MRFSGAVSTYLTLVDHARYWSGTNSTSYPIGPLTRNINLALDRVTVLIMRSDARWQWDDINNADEPIGTTALTSGQRQYSIGSAHLKILKVRIRDPQGNFVSLDPVDRRDLTDSQLTEGNGTPRKYDKIGDSIHLYPAPNHTNSAGLEVQVQRGANPFVDTDTTKEPGFASPFHSMVSFFAALDHCDLNGLERRAQTIRSRLGIDIHGRIVGGLAAELVDFYSSRDRDEKKFLSLRKEDYGERALGSGSRNYSHPDKFILP